MRLPKSFFKRVAVGRRGLERVKRDDNKWGHLCWEYISCWQTYGPNCRSPLDSLRQVIARWATEPASRCWCSLQKSQIPNHGSGIPQTTAAFTQAPLNKLLHLFNQACSVLVTQPLCNSECYLPCLFFLTTIVFLPLGSIDCCPNSV